MRAMRTKTLRWMTALSALAALVVVASGCQTGGVKGKDSPESHGATAAGSNADTTITDEIDGETPEEAGAPTVKDPVADSGSRGGHAIGEKYQALARVVRAGKSNAIVEEAAKILGSNPNDPVALNTLALFHFRRGKIGAAKLLINRAFEKNQGTAALYNNYAIILLEEGDQSGAVVNFKKALRIDDHHAEAMGNLGSMYVQGGDFLKALPLLEQSYRLNRNNLAIANNYAIALRANKSYEGARKIYDEILKQNSRDVPALLNLAILLIDFMGKPKDGLALVYKVKFLETERKDVLSRVNALEKKAKSELK